MDTNYLLEFIILSESGSYAKASQKLFLTESTLSRHIKQLEAEYKVQLFERDAKSTTLSKYGRLLLPYAKEMMSIFSNSRHAIRKAQDEKDNLVRLVINYPVHEIIAGVNDSDLNIQVMTLGSRHSAEANIGMLDDDKADVIMLSNPTDSDLDNLNVIHYTDDFYSVVMSASHPLSSRKRLTISELRSEAFITFGNDIFCDENLTQLFNDAGFKPDIICTADKGSDIAELTKYGGIAILMNNTIARKNDRNLALVPLEPRINVSIYFAARKGKPLKETTQIFLDYVKEHTI